MHFALVCVDPIEGIEMRLDRAANEQDVISDIVTHPRGTGFWFGIRLSPKSRWLVLDRKMDFCRDFYTVNYFMEIRIYIYDIY